MLGVNSKQDTRAIKTIAVVGNGDSPAGEDILVLFQVLAPFEAQAHLHMQFDAEPDLEQ